MTPFYIHKTTNVYQLRHSFTHFVTSTDSTLDGLLKKAEIVLKRYVSSPESEEREIRRQSKLYTMQSTFEARENDVIVEEDQILLHQLFTRLLEDKKEHINNRLKRGQKSFKKIRKLKRRGAHNV